MTSEKLENFREQLSDEKTSVSMYLVRRAPSNSKLTAINPTIKSDLGDVLKTIIDKNLSRYKEKYTSDLVAQYTPLGSTEEHLETISVVSGNNGLTYGKKLDEILDSLKNPTVNFRFNQKNFDFFVYRVGINDDEKVGYFFRTVLNTKKFSKGFLGKVSPGIYTKIDENDLIGADDFIDFCYIDDELFVIRHTAIERVLGLHDEFKTAAEQVLNNEKLKSKISGYEEFKKDVLNNKSFIKRVAKLDVETSNKFIEHLDKTKLVIDQFNLGVEIDKDKVLYNGIESTSELINLMKDAYYETLIGNTKGVDMLN